MDFPSIKEVGSIRKPSKPSRPSRPIKIIIWAAIIIAIIILRYSVAYSDQNKDLNKPLDFISIIQPKDESKDELPPFPTGSVEPILKDEKPQVVPVITKTRKTPQTAPIQATNENIVWAYLIKQGFSRNQTAGIMGNLRQEHNFQTSGDGLAQWNGGRKARLMAMPNPYSIETQLQFLMIELNGNYLTVKNQIMATDDVITATRVFQNQFERCGVCAESNRVNYAFSILAGH